MEITYSRAHPLANERLSPNVRWLDVQEYDLFVRHLELCGQKPLARKIWESAYHEGGTIYCGLFQDGKMIARACVEKYSPDCWEVEVADVRTAKSYRLQGSATKVSTFVLRYILSQGKTATIRTEEDNFAMQRVIEKLEFSEISSNA